MLLLHLRGLDVGDLIHEAVEERVHASMEVCTRRNSEE